MNEELIGKIFLFLKNKDTNSLSVPMMPLDDIEKIMGLFGYTTEEPCDTNGWQVDFWYTFGGGEEDLSLPVIVLSGSLHYGQFTLKKE